MARTTFYTHVAEPYAFACRLTQKAWLGGARVLVWLPDADTLAVFDQLLWSFDPVSFVPHALWLPETPQPPRGDGVLLASGSRLPQVADDTVVLNLSDAYWHQARQPARILEIIGSDVDALAAARTRFRAYRDAGFEIEHHNMQNTPHNR